MKKLTNAFILLCLFLTTATFAQAINGKSSSKNYILQGKVTDSNTGEACLFASVALYQNGVILTGTETNLDGFYFFTIDSLGVYDVEVSYVGYQPLRISDVVLLSTNVTVVDVVLSEGLTLNEATIVCYKAPQLDYDSSSTGATVTADEIRSLPTKNITALASTACGASVVDGQDVSIRGSRTAGSYYYIDGVRGKGDINNIVAQSEISQVQVIMSGTDARYERAQNKSDGGRLIERQEEINSDILLLETPVIEEYSHIIENKFLSSKNNPLSTFSIDVDRASYSNVRRYIQRNEMPPPDAVRIEEMINYFPYEYDQPTEDIPFNVVHTLTECPWNKKHQILHVGVKGVEIEQEDLAPMNLVFLIDVSGSMNSYNKLALVKSSLNLLVDNMRAKDKIALVVYAGSAGLVLDSTSGKYKGEIKAAIENLSAGGSTAGGAGINLAYQVAKENFIKKGNNRVLLATDGDFNVGVSDEGGLVRLIEKKRDDNIFLSVLGYGMGNYKDNKMQQLADSGNGNHAYIDNLKEANKTLVEEFGGTLFTIAKDVKIQIEFNPEFVKEYKLIGYENRMLSKEDFNDDKKDAGELGAGHTVTAFYEIVPVSTRKDESVAVDELKYQGMTSAENQIDLATIKLRYKKPKGTKSELIEEVISPILSYHTSSDIEFALCVAEFGLLLRGSKSVKESSFINLLKRSRDLVTADDAYRDEFVSLIETVIGINSESEE